MSKFLKASFSIFVLTLIFNGFAVTEAKAQSILNEILKRMDSHYKLLKSLKADIKRVKTDTTLGESDEYTGNLVLLPGKGRNFSVRLDWRKPKEENLSIVNGQYVAYVPSIKRAYTGSSNSAKASEKGGNVLRIMSMSKEELKANYDIQYLGQEQVTGAIQTWHLKLTPKTKASYKFAELWVDGDGMPIQAKIVALNNDTDEVLISNLQKNVSIDGSIFSINLPKGTELVKG